MLTKEQIENNKQNFIALLRTIKREGANIEGLIKKLENSDFFTAPASSQYHCCYEGGLCEHSLNVYQNFLTLKNVKNLNFSSESILIISLLHDLSKMNFYETSIRNVKEGNNWVQVPFIKVKDQKDRFLYSDHGTNSAFMVNNFIPLTFEEEIAIMHHMGWSDEHINAITISNVFNNYSLALFLHMADLMSTFIDERI